MRSRLPAEAPLGVRGFRIRFKVTGARPDLKVLIDCPTLKAAIPHDVQTDVRHLGGRKRGLAAVGRRGCQRIAASAVWGSHNLLQNEGCAPEGPEAS